MEKGEHKHHGHHGHHAEVAAVRKPAPAIKTKAVKEGQINEFTLESLKGSWVVLFFWPLDFTFVCPTEILAYDATYDAFKENECHLVGCSIDSVFSHLEWTKKSRKEGGLGEMKMTMLSDVGGHISKKYGCLIEEGDDAGVAFRATYIIDPKGVLRHISISDLPVGRNPDETLRLVKALQYADKHGEVCPAKWVPGAKTLVPKPGADKNKEYFAEVK